MPRRAFRLTILATRLLVPAAALAQPPTVTVNSASGQADPTYQSPILFSADFSEPVSGFVDADVVLGGSAGATTAAVSGGPSSYLIAVSGMVQSGVVSAGLAAGAATDIDANPSEASTSLDNTVTFQASVVAVPALAEPALAALAVLLACVGALVLRRRPAG